MRLVSKVIVAGAATLALAGGAVAAERAMHVMNVALPDGSIEHIHYTGDQPPKVAIVPVDLRAAPVAMIDPPFAAFDRMFADLDAQAAAMMRQVAAMPRMPLAADGRIDPAALKSLPAGTVSYSYYSSTGGGCTQSYQMTSYGGPNQPAKVVSHSSGDCSAVSQPLVPTAAAPAAKPAPMTPVRAAPTAKAVPRDAA